MDKLQGESTLLRIFVGELDKADGKPLYEVIVYAAKKMGLAGATVLRGIMSYGAASIIHSAKIISLSDDLPIVIEIVDDDARIQEFIQKIEHFFPNSKYGGLITTEKVNVIYYKPGVKN